MSLHEHENRKCTDCTLAILLHTFLRISKYFLVLLAKKDRSNHEHTVVLTLPRIASPNEGGFVLVLVSTWQEALEK